MEVDNRKIDFQPQLLTSQDVLLGVVNGRKAGFVINGDRLVLDL
jgi:hypothetical protein